MNTSGNYNGKGSSAPDKLVYELRVPESEARSMAPEVSTHAHAALKVSRFRRLWPEARGQSGHKETTLVPPSLPQLGRMICWMV